jgi:hypothetical protein
VQFFEIFLRFLKTLTKINNVYKIQTNMNKRKVIYAEAPNSISREIAEGEVVDDFLPPPEELVRKEPKVKITIT